MLSSNLWRHAIWQKCTDTSDELFFYPDDGGRQLLWKVDTLLPQSTALPFRVEKISIVIEMWELEISQPYFIVILFQYEMGGACSTYGGKERCIQDFGGETWGKATTWETQA
jgi:hypothetical protein